MPEVSFILPALNEGRGIGKVIDRIPVRDLTVRGYDVNVWLLDGHSTDHTVAVALARGARVVVQEGMGKGRAVSQALNSIGSDYIIMLDADNTYDPIDVMSMMPLLEDGHDVVMGSRLNGVLEEDSMTLRNFLGNKLLSMTASVLYAKRVSDVCTGFWGFKGRVARELPIDAKGFELEAQMFSRCAKSGLVIGEVPIRYGRRAEDETKLRCFRSGIGIMFSLFRERFRSRRRLRARVSRPVAHVRLPPLERKADIHN
jgi:glycosyltransferase involved in cell wall biosynthesis